MFVTGYCYERVGVWSLQSLVWLIQPALFFSSREILAVMKSVILCLLHLCLFEHNLSFQLFLSSYFNLVYFISAFFSTYQYIITTKVAAVGADVAAVTAASVLLMLNQIHFMMCRGNGEWMAWWFWASTQHICHRLHLIKKKYHYKTTMALMEQFWHSIKEFKGVDTGHPQPCALY